jgi:hypothetical protein
MAAAITSLSFEPYSFDVEEGGTPLLPKVRPSRLKPETTALASTIDETLARVGALHPNDTPLADDQPESPIVDEEEVEDNSQGIATSAFERANTARIELLARQFAGRKLSNEEHARLEISAARVRNTLPRVTVSDYEAIEEVVNVVEQAERKIADVRRRLGLEPDS